MLYFFSLQFSFIIMTVGKNCIQADIFLFFFLFWYSKLNPGGAALHLGLRGPPGVLSRVGSLRRAHHRPGTEFKIFFAPNDSQVTQFRTLSGWLQPSIS